MGRAKQTKKQHYIPRFYLRHFVDSSGKLHVYNRENDAYYASSPADTCEEQYLYEVEYSQAPKVDTGRHFRPNEIENRLQVLEDKLAPPYEALFKFCDTLDFKAEEFQKSRAAICALAAHLLARHPLLLRDERERAEDFAQEFKHDIGSLSALEIERLEEAGWHGDFLALTEYAIIDTLLFSTDARVPTNRAYQAFLKKHLAVLEAPFGTPFITSSLPLDIVHDSGDVNSYEFQVAYMPLSSKYAAFFSDGQEGTATLQKLTPEAVKEYNTALLNDTDIWSLAIARAENPLRETVFRWKLTQSLGREVTE